MPNVNEKKNQDIPKNSIISCYVNNNRQRGCVVSEAVTLTDWGKTDDYNCVFFVFFFIAVKTRSTAMSLYTPVYLLKTRSSFAFFMTFSLFFFDS